MHGRHAQQRRVFFKEGKNEIVQRNSPLCVSILDQDFKTCRSKSESSLKNTLDEFHLCDTFLYHLFVIDDPFLKGGIILEEPRAKVSLSLLCIVYQLASLFDTLVLKLCGPQLVGAKLLVRFWESPWILKTPCHLHRVGQVDISNGTLGSMLNTMIEGTPTH